MNYIRYSILGFSQKAACQFVRSEEKNGKQVEQRLDVVDLLIVNHIADFPNRKGVVKQIINDKTYFWVSYSEILEELPILGIKKQALADRFTKLEAFGIIERVFSTVGKMQNTSMFRMGDAYEQLKYAPNEEVSYSTTTPSRSQVQDIDNSNNIAEEESITDVMPKKFDFRSSVIGLGVPPNIVDDWLKVRKTKRASNTETAFNLMEKEVAKACELYPMATPEILVKIAVERNWMGVRCDFYRNVNFSDYIDEQPKEAARQLPLFDEKWQ